MIEKVLSMMRVTGRLTTRLTDPASTASGMKQKAASPGRRHGWENRARYHGVFGSFGFGWFGILLLRLNLPEDVELIPLIFEAFRRLSRLEIGQGQCPVLNLEDGDDHFADGGIRFALRTIVDDGA